MEQYQEVTNDVFWVGVKHADLQIFDELFPTRNGTTYNSYVVKGKAENRFDRYCQSPV